ncbi:MAG: hypothetical protein N2491_03135 [Negativicutes bacterium]|nr:hypothetical protein [Negativicutes bacterium]
MKVEAANVKMSLNPGIVDMLDKIGKAGRSLADRCQDNLDEKINMFNDGVATYAAHTKRAILEEERNRHNFNIRMLNTEGFFNISQTVFDAVIKGVAMRKKAVEMLGATLFDLVLELGFGKLDDMKKAKNGAGNAELLEKSVKEMQQQYITKAIKGFEAKISELLQSAAQNVTKAQEALNTVVAAATKANQKAEQHLNWILKRMRDGKVVPVVARENFKSDFEHLIKLLIKQAELEKQLVSVRRVQEALEPMRKNLAELSAEGGDVMEKWHRLFGPSSPGETMFAEARRQCQSQLDQLRHLKETELAQWSQKIAALSPEFKGLVENHIAEANRLAAELSKMNQFDCFMIDTKKNFTGAASQKLAQLHDVEQEQQQRMNKGFFYSIWVSLWESLSSIGSALKNWLAEKVEYILGNFITGLITKAAGLAAWLITGFFWAVMEIFKYIAGMVEYIGRLRNPTYLEGDYRTRGQKIMTELGVPEGHFYAEGQEEAIKGIVHDADPDNLPDVVNHDKAATQQLKTELKAKAKQQAADRQEAEKNAYRKAVMAMCAEALDTERFNREVEAMRYSEVVVRSVLFDVALVMKYYEKQFEQCDAGFVDFVAMKADEMLEGVDFTWASIANWLSLLGSQATLTARGIAVAATAIAPFTGGASLLPAATIFGVAELFDKITVWTRLALCTFFVIPCVNAFAGDFMAMHGVSFATMIRETESVPQPKLGVDPQKGVPNKL